MSRALDAWISANRPREPRISINTPVSEYERLRSEYTEALREYARKLGEISERHRPELNAAFADFTGTIDSQGNVSRSNLRTFEIHKKED